MVDLSDYIVEWHLDRIEDPKGSVTRFGYDFLDRKISLDDPDSGHWEYQYDLNGSMKRQDGPGGMTTQLDYDGFGRVILKHMTSHSAPPVEIRYRYDSKDIANGIGRLYEANRGIVTDRTEGYDSMGRLLGSTRIFTDLQKSYTTRSRYDVAGRTIEMTYPDNTRISHDLRQSRSLVNVNRSKRFEI